MLNIYDVHLGKTHTDISEDTTEITPIFAL